MALTRKSRATAGGPKRRIHSGAKGGAVAPTRKSRATAGAPKRRIHSGAKGGAVAPTRKNRATAGGPKRRIHSGAKGGGFRGCGAAPPDSNERRRPRLRPLRRADRAPARPGRLPLGPRADPRDREADDDRGGLRGRRGHRRGRRRRAGLGELGDLLLQVVFHADIAARARGLRDRRGHRARVGQDGAPPPPRLRPGDAPRPRARCCATGRPSSTRSARPRARTTAEESMLDSVSQAPARDHGGVPDHDQGLAGGLRLARRGRGRSPSSTRRSLS